MACSSKPGVKPFLDYIETATGEKITQADWHDIRELTAQEYGIEGKLPKNLVKKSDVITLLLHLDVDFCNQEDYEDNGEAYDDAWSAVEGKPVTQGTVMALGYLRDNGIEDTLAQVRLDRTAKKAGDNGVAAVPAVTSQRPAWTEVIESEGGGYSDDGRVKLEWTDLGEGVDGDYDEDNEDDIPLLRYDAYVRIPENPHDMFADEEFEGVEYAHRDSAGVPWGQKRNSSFCTNVSVNTPRAELNRLAEKMADRLADNLDNGGWKGTAAELSWVGDSELARVRDELEKE